MKKLILLLVLIISLMTQASAAHYIVGIVNDALDGMQANGHTVMLWQPANGMNDNQTDIIGPSGNSGTDNIYMIDCELLNDPCNVGDTVAVQVIDNGDGYVTENVTGIVTGAGYDTLANLTLNSRPNVILITPNNNQNVSATVTFNCSIEDLDGNLVNVTLYGNWSGSWHANETKSIIGLSNSTTFTKNLTNGIYEWNCKAYDNLSIHDWGNSNYTFRVDTTPPNITSVIANQSDACRTDYVRVECTVRDDVVNVSAVWIEVDKPTSSNQNYTAYLLSDDTWYADIQLTETGEWQFNCWANDTLNSVGNRSNGSVIVYTLSADLTLNFTDIIFSNTNPMENESIIINATIYNKGCQAAGSFSVGFFENDPATGGIQLNGNRTITSLSGKSNTTVNITWQAEIGITNVFVWGDNGNSVSEENETNNKANNTINVNSWQEFYGNTSLNKLLADASKYNLTAWLNATTVKGNILILDEDNDISWTSLQALGRNRTGSIATNDFSDIDSLLNMADLNDSVSIVFTSDGNTPKKTQTFTVQGKTIANVPIVNSTNNSNFVTGILWDTDDDSDGEYSITDVEDLVFVAAVNQSRFGKYGMYDYEIKIPVKLRGYKGPGTGNVALYYELY